MRSRHVRDIISGSALILLGMAYAWYGLNYRMGTMVRIGPGVAPVALGILLAFVGGLVVIGGLMAPRRVGERFELRPMLGVLASLLAFAYLVRPYGLVPATFTLTIIATLANDRTRPLFALLLASALSLLAYLLFIRLIGIPVAPFGRNFVALLSGGG